MTVQYQGNDIYKVFIGEKEIVLSQDEINEIQNWDFVNENDIEHEVENLEDSIDILYSNTDKLHDELSETIKELETTTFSNKEDCDNMKAIREQLVVINDKLTEI